MEGIGDWNEWPPAHRHSVQGYNMSPDERLLWAACFLLFLSNLVITDDDHSISDRSQKGKSLYPIKYHMVFIVSSKECIRSLLDKITEMDVS